MLPFLDRFCNVPLKYFPPIPTRVGILSADHCTMLHVPMTGIKNNNLRTATENDEKNLANFFIFFFYFFPPIYVVLIKTGKSQGQRFIIFPQVSQKLLHHLNALQQMEGLISATKYHLFKSSKYRDDFKEFLNTRLKTDSFMSLILQS